jgi:hypothetical protein
MPITQCQISTDDRLLIKHLLEQEEFRSESNSSILIKSNPDCHVHVDVSLSFELPSIICCSSANIASLSSLLTCLSSTISSTIPLILLSPSTDLIDWNPLIRLISTYNIAMHAVPTKQDLKTKLMNIIQDLVKQRMKKSFTLLNPVSDKSRASTQVDKIRYFLFFFYLNPYFSCSIMPKIDHAYLVHK